MVHQLRQRHRGRRRAPASTYARHARVLCADHPCVDPGPPAEPDELGQLLPFRGENRLFRSRTATESVRGGPEPEMPPHGRDNPRPLSVSLRVRVGDLEVHVTVASKRGRLPGFGHLGPRFRPGCRNERVIGLTDGGGHDMQPGAVERDPGLKVAESGGPPRSSPPGRPPPPPPPPTLPPILPPPPPPLPHS